MKKPLSRLSPFTGAILTKSILLFLVLISLGSCGDGSESGSSASDATLSTNACPQLRVNKRIINGTGCGSIRSAIVKISIVALPDTLGTCSGVVISPRRVLTAGHCFARARGARAAVEINGDLFAAQAVSIHPNYEVSEIVGAIFNDVAVLRFATDLPAPVAQLSPLTVRAGDPIVIAGFGTTGGSDVSREIRSGEMLVSETTSNHILAQYSGEGSNTCTGDSGGPALVESENGNLVVQGILSTGTDEGCGVGDTSVFQRIDVPGVQAFINAAL